MSQFRFKCEACKAVVQRPVILKVPSHLVVRFCSVWCLSAWLSKVRRE